MGPLCCAHKQPPYNDSECVCLSRIKYESEIKELTLHRDWYIFVKHQRGEFMHCFIHNVLFHKIKGNLGLDLERLAHTVEYPGKGNIHRI